MPLATHPALGVARGGVHIVVRLVGIADSQFRFNPSVPLQVVMFMALFGTERVSGLTKLLFALFQSKAKQRNAKQSKAKECKAMQSKGKQSNAKQSKANYK